MPDNAVPPATDRPSVTSRRGAGVRTVRFQDLVLLLVRGAPFALLVTGLAVAAAVLFTRAQDPVYRASVALVVAQDASGLRELDVIVPPAVDAAVYQTALYDGDVLRAALERVEGRDLGDREYLRLSEAVRVRVETQQMSSVVRVEATDTSPERAASLVNAIADELVDWDRARARRGVVQGVAALERSIAAIDAELATADGTLSEARQATLGELRAQRVVELEQARDTAAAAVAVARIEPLAPATPPEEAVGPRLVLNTAIALVLGLVAGYGLLLASWMTNPRVGHRNDLAAFAGVPVLAEFARRDPRQKGLSEEGINWLRTRLGTSRHMEGSRMLVVAGLRSVADEDGVAVGLAESFARGGDDTLMIDADLRNACATDVLGVGTTRGTPYDDVMAEDPTPGYAPISVVVSRERTFQFLPAAVALSHPVDRLIRLFDDRAATWRTEHDVVIVSAAPLLQHADGLAVAEHADGVVLCARRGSTTRADVEQALAILGEQRVPVVGAVLTHARATANAGPSVQTGLSRRLREERLTARMGTASVRSKPSRRS